MDQDKDEGQTGHPQQEEDKGVEDEAEVFNRGVTRNDHR